MRYILFFVAISLALALHRSARGHGDPILLRRVENRLTVSQINVAFPPQIVGQVGSLGLPNEEVTFLPGPGEIVYWDVPGLDISGLADTSRLSIEPLVRPVVGSPTAEERLVWYWNPVNELVEPSAVDLYLLGVAPRFTTLSATNVASPGAFLLADPVAAQQGFHNHGLLNYAIDNSSGAPSGVYGFFARFLSNVHEASEAFLIVLNNGVASADLIPAAEAIFAAATDLPGDFNHDGIVDAADYTVWRDGSLGPEKYAEWKSHFGQSAANGGAANSISVVPEPSLLVLIASILVCGAGVFARISRPQANLSPRSQHSS